MTAKILIVEDDTIALATYLMGLKRQGFALVGAEGDGLNFNPVRDAKNSHHALAVLKKADQEVHIASHLGLANEAVANNDYRAAYLDFSLGSSETTRQLATKLIHETRTTLRLTSSEPENQLALLQLDTGAALAEHPGRAVITPKSFFLKPDEVTAFFTFFGPAEPSRPTGGGPVPGDAPKPPQR